MIAPWRWLRSLSSERLLRASAVLTLGALALMVWSLVRPTPLPIILAMSLGQLLGTIAFAIYLAVVVRDLRRARGGGDGARPGANAPTCERAGASSVEAAGAPAHHEPLATSASSSAGSTIGAPPLGGRATRSLGSKRPPLEGSS